MSLRASDAAAALTGRGYRTESRLIHPGDVMVQSYRCYPTTTGAPAMTPGSLVRATAPHLSGATPEEVGTPRRELQPRGAHGAKDWR